LGEETRKGIRNWLRLILPKGLKELRNPIRRPKEAIKERKGKLLG